MTQLVDWYSPTNIKSYNKFLNFIIGGRGIGKTYGFKKDCISRYKKKGKQFLYLRRYKTDLKKIKTFLFILHQIETLLNYIITIKLEYLLILRKNQNILGFVWIILERMGAYK